MKRSGGLERALRWMLHFHRYTGVRRWTVTALAAVVVFCAVYNLILPAAAITGRIARETPGIELGTESGSEGLDAVRTNETALGESSGEQPEMTGGGQTDPDGWEEIPGQQGNETDGAAAITTEEAAGQSEEAAGTQEGTSGQTEGTTDSGQSAESTEETTGQEQTGEGTEGQQDPEQDASQEDPAGPEETAEESDETAAQEEAADQEEAEETEETEDALDEEENEEEESEEEAEEEETIFEAGSLKARGAGYRVELIYGADARIPQDAKLFADEITEDSPLYEDYVRKTEETLFGETGTASYIRMFDIHIEDPEGEKVQPAEGSSVDVKIELDDKAEDAPVQVVHFAEKEEAGEAETGEEKDPSADQKKATEEDNKEDMVTAEEPDDEAQPEEIENTESIVLEEVSVEGTSVSFTTDGFSAYAIVEGPEPVPIGWEKITSLDELVAGGLYVGNPEGFFMTNKLTVDSKRTGITKTKPASSNPPSNAAKYYFEKVEDTVNQYYAYCYAADGTTKQYVYNGGNNSLSFKDETNRTAFTVAVDDQGRFTFKNGDWYWNQQGSANGTRFCSYDKEGDPNNYFYLWHESVPEEDPYSLNGASYGFMNWNGGAAGKAVMGSQTGNNLDAKQLTVLSKKTDNGDKLFVPKDSEISMWTFEWDESDKYYLKTTADGSTKYLKISDGGLELVSDWDAAGTVQVVPGTGTHKGEICLKANGATLTYSGALDTGFTIGGSAGTEWLHLVEESELTEEYMMPHSAKKVSVSDPTVTNGSKVIVYTRVWNEDMKRYDYYAIGSNGEAVQCYDGGNTIEWVGGVINTMLWDFTDYLDDNGDPTYYYELQNEYSGKYLAPNDADDTILSDDTIGLNMNGRRAGKYQSSILAWDDGSYAYSGLKVENGKIVACPKSEAMDFYFATMEEMPTGDVLHTVPTVDHEKYGITMKITDFETRTEMSNFLGNDEGAADTKLHQGLLSTNLGDDGYPVATRTGGTTLGDLYGKPTQTQVNHLFIKSTYEESGYFEFDSSQNFATLAGEGSSGKDFTVYRELGSYDSGGNKPSLKHGQFFPFDTIQPGVFAANNGRNLYTATKQELSDSDPRKNEQLYMIGNDNPDCFFGVELEASFTQTPNGHDAWGHDIIFEFTGDDDFWLYVDGELTIDLGGIHSAVGGSVNFSTGDVYVNGKHTTLREVFTNNYKKRNPGASQADINSFLSEYFEPGENVFKEYSTHTMRIFYMERGASASNLHMRFNLASVQPGTVELSKKLDGVDNAESMFAEFPYQIKYKRKGDSTEYLLENGDEKYVFYKDTDLRVPFKSSVTIGGVDYRNVYMLKPGEEAEIRFPTFVTDHGDETIDTYSIVECGVNTSVYEKVSVNGTEVAGTSESSYQENRKDFGIGFATTDKRARVEYENKVKKDALRSLTFKKKLYSEDGTTEITDDTTPFAFRLYLGTESDPLSLANMHTYHVKDPSGNYCIWDKTQRKLVSLGKSNYDALTKEEKEAASFTTSINGSITNIPAGYQVEVRDLLVDTKYRIEERPGEIPDGYSYKEYREITGDGSEENPVITPVKKNSIPGAEGTINPEEDPHVGICNLKGYGLRVNKTWTDEDFMEDRDPTYFAVFTRDGQGNLTLVEDTEHEIYTVRQLPFGEKTLYWYFCPLPVTGVPFIDYEIREVKLSNNNPTVDEDGYVKDHGTVTPIDEGEELRLSGKQKGEHGSGEPHTYTVHYEKGSVDAGANVRVDETENRRSGGILIKKEDWSGNALAGAEFTLKTGEGEHQTVIGTYTSGTDGTVTTAFLDKGYMSLILEETKAPQGYHGLPSEATISKHGDGIQVNVQDSDYYDIKEGQHHQPTVLILKNRPYTFRAVKRDQNTKVPLQGAKFALHREVTVGGITIIDVNPMTHYESLITGVDGVIPRIDETLPAGTYELREKEPPTGYQQLSEHIQFTISPTGTITLKSGPEDVTLESGEGSGGALAYEMTIPNAAQKRVSIWKTDTGFNAITIGADFALYNAEDYDDDTQTPRSGAKPVVSGTTDSKGILALGLLDSGEYRLVETRAPQDYDRFIGAVQIIIGGDVRANQGSADAEVVRRDQPHWVPGQADDTWQIRVWNSNGVVLPSTGGRGTRIFTILGALMILGAGVMLFSRRKA